ncbi:unnamed protein product [Rhodiola kirilowii]
MSLKEGQRTNRPPLLEGPNYGYWKPRMKAFLKSLDEKAWRAVMIGWTEPMMANPEEAVMPKPEALWSEADDEAAVGNSKALNAIFYGVDQNVFKLIGECEVANEAWDILRIVYEGSESETNDEEEEHENVNLVGHAVTIEDGSETSENPYSSTLSEQPIDNASSSDDEGLAHETSAETYKELYEKCLLVIGLNKKLTETVASLTEEEDKQWQEVEPLVAQKVEHQEEISALKHEMIGMNQEPSSRLAQKVKLLDTVTVLKAEMEKKRETHPACLVGLRRKNAELHIRKEVHLNMTGNPRYLIIVKSICELQLVTFGDGGKGQVIGCGTLKVPDLPVLEDILLVDGLKVNLISISRLCDEGQSVTFTRDSCQVLDRNGDTLLEGSRSTNKCYCLGTVGTGAATVCLTNTIHEMELQGTGMVSSSGKVKDDVAANSVLEDKIPEGGLADEATPTLAGTLDDAPALQPSWRIKSRANEIKCRELAACSSSPKNVIKTFIDETWVVAIHVELGEFTRSKAWMSYHLAHSHELKKTMYGLTQAPRAWYETFLIDHGYERGGVERMFVTSTQKLVGQFVRLKEKEMKHLPGTHVDQMLGEQESIAACCTQFLWMKQNLSEHGVE